MLILPYEQNNELYSTREPRRPICDFEGTWVRLQASRWVSMAIGWAPGWASWLSLLSSNVSHCGSWKSRYGSREGLFSSRLSLCDSRVSLCSSRAEPPGWDYYLQDQPPLLLGEPTWLWDQPTRLHGKPIRLQGDLRIGDNILRPLWWKKIDSYLVFNIFTMV